MARANGIAEAYCGSFDPKHFLVARLIIKQPGLRGAKAKPANRPVFCYFVGEDSLTVETLSSMGSTVGGAKAII